MIQKEQAELARAKMLKTIRTAIRLKYSLLADEELNTVLPEAERRFTLALQKGNVLAPPDLKKLGLK